jgi:hypothetical protein
VRRVFVAEHHLRTQSCEHLEHLEQSYLCRPILGLLIISRKLVARVINEGGGSSDSIVSDCELDEGFDPQQRQKDISSSLCVQTGSGAHPAPCTMGTGGLFSGSKARPGRDADHSPHLVLRSRMSTSYTSPPKRLSGM